MDLKERTILGRTGLKVTRLGIAASYGVGADAIERAYGDYGINYLYWGSARRASFGEGIRRLATRHREDLVIVVQSYTRLSALVSWSVDRALRDLRLDHADILLLGWYNRRPWQSVMEAAHRLKDQGKVRFLAVSCHRRPTFTRYVEDGEFDVLMFRYNAAHRGAEREVLPLLRRENRPGAVSYTATRWGQLINPARVPSEEKVPRASDCYRFVLTQPEVDVCLTGPADETQLRKALTALDRGPMSPEEWQWMCRVGDHVYRKGWRR